MCYVSQDCFRPSSIGYLLRQTITNDELWQQIKSLNGATMPDGQKYEDWLKSKGRGEDGENGGLS
jgi:hypothetical protein